MNTPDDPSSREPAPTGWRTSAREVAPYLGLGMELALTIGVTTGGGYALDRWLDTAPWLMLVGAVLGFAAIMLKLVRLSRGSSRGGSDPSEPEA